MLKTLKIPVKIIIDGKEHPSYLEIAEDRRCYNCGTSKSPAWYSPHFIAMNHGFHYCQTCWDRLYPEGNRFCGLRKDPTHRN